MAHRPTKAEILDQIRLYVSDNGQTPGMGAFFKFSGITESAVTYHWPKWSDAVSEAGFTPLTVPELIDKDSILSKLAELTMELGHFPTVKEYSIICRGREDLPAEITVRKRLGKVENRIAELRAFAHANSKFSSLLEILKISRREATSSREKVVKGYVYLRKLPGRYKLGRSISIPKREQQHKTKTWESSELLHVIETDDPAGIEDYWKRRFKEKNKKEVDSRQKDITPTEEYYLTNEDVEAFCWRTFQ
jgi:hypothetical protein